MTARRGGKNSSRRRRAPLLLPERNNETSAVQIEWILFQESVTVFQEVLGFRRKKSNGKILLTNFYFCFLLGGIIFFWPWKEGRGREGRSSCQKFLQSESHETLFYCDISSHFCWVAAFFLNWKAGN